MNIKGITRIILVLSFIALFVTFACAQRPVQTPGAAGVKTLEGTKVTVKGKIDYMKSLNGYIVRGETPADEYIIVNQDPKLLEELMKSGKTVTIEGHYTLGADHLFIEKIDGQPYQGAKNQK